MGITLGQLRGRLIGELDVIPPASANERINDALREIYDESDWGFLFEDGFIRTPELIEGTASVEKFSDSVILDASIIAKIQAIHEFDVDIFERQFRVVNVREVPRGFTYRITDIDFGTNTITIDPPYQDVDNLAAKIQILKVYYKPPFFQPTYEKGVDPVPDPIIDFRRFDHIISPHFRRRLGLNVSQAELHKIDPYRETISEPRFFVTHSIDTKFLLDSDGNRIPIYEPVFEIYPAPRFARVFQVKYVRLGLPLLHDDEQVPDIFTKELILSKAKPSIYSWAKANADKLKLKTVGRFDNLIALAKNEYNEHLEKAKKKDEERYPKAYLGNYLDYAEYTFDDLHCYSETLVLNF